MKSGSKSDFVAIFKAKLLQPGKVTVLVRIISYVVTYINFERANKCNLYNDILNFIEGLNFMKMFTLNFLC